MCIFCQIAKKEIPVDLIFEDDNIIAFKDIKPSAPVHLLVVPKKHIESLVQIDITDRELLGDLIYRAKFLAAEQGIDVSGYKVVINTGQDGGQVISHLHIHLLGGGKIGELV